MSKHELQTNFSLTTGGSCQLLRIKNELIANYYLLTFAKTQGEPSANK